MTLARTLNPLLGDHAIRTVDLAQLKSPTILRRPRTHQRDLRQLWRRQSAQDAVKGLDHATEIYGFTKGQFSLLDLIEAALAITGPAHLDFSTWTAARHEIQALVKLRQERKLTGIRWLVDFTFARRDPEAANAIRQQFGLDAMRVAQCHSKFAVFANANWKLCLRSSMNLNMNPRTEDFTLAHDPDLAAFITRIMDEIWAKQQRRIAQADGREQRRHFREDLT